MFYYPVVLRRDTGCFATIWLAATRGIPVPRRECLKVNVGDTCENIISYITEQVPPPLPHLPRPRFSLYLSSQLQYGVVVVYHRQCVIFLKELQSIIGQLVKHKKPMEISTKTSGKKTLVVANEDDMMMDPLFGVIDELFLPEEEMPDRQVSPEMPGPSRMSSSSSSSNITAAPQDITLREPEAGSLRQPEFEGEDLIDNVLDTLEILMSQNNNFLDEVDRPVAAPEPEEARERAAEPGTDATLEVDPVSTAAPDVTSLPDAPTEIAQMLADQATPVSAPPPSLSISDIEAVPRPGETEMKREKRKRQLIFFDPQTQIPHKELEKQFKDPLLETRVRPLLPPASLKLKSASELLREPCGVLPEELMFLWRQAATITPVDRAELWPLHEDIESSDSDQENLKATEREEAAIEIPRHGAEPETPDISGPVSIALEASGTLASSREVSPFSLIEPDRSKHSPTMQSIPEMPANLETLEEEMKENVVLFHDLLPSDADRRTASKNFQKVLGLFQSKKLRAEQAEPYGDILIFPGSNYSAPQ
ncbi:meiotic recombination protein REC8 homolog isoform X2 [Stigmatopora argus]